MFAPLSIVLKCQIRADARLSFPSSEVVCGEAADGKEALKRVRKLRPEVVLLDIYVPGKNGLEVAREIRQVSPATKIIFLTVHAAPTRKHAARALGTDGFVAKSTAGIQLIPALERVLLEA